MGNDRQAIVKELIVIGLVVVLLAGVGGLLVRNVIVSLRAADETSAAAAETKVFSVDDLVKGVQEFIDSLQPQKNAPASPPVQPNPAVPAGETKPAVPAAKIDLRSVRFFEGPKEQPAAKDRQYASSFTLQARYIYLEGSYKNNNYQKNDSDVLVVAQLQGPDGRLLAERRGTIKINMRNAEGTFSTNWGSDTPGFWRPGEYKLTITLDGIKAGEYTFRVE